MSNTTKRTLTQSEELEIGQRGEYAAQNSALAARCERLEVKCWVEKRRKPVTADDKKLAEFIDLPMGYKLVYGITYKGKDYDCGDMPRDIGRVTRGMEIALAAVNPQ